MYKLICSNLTKSHRSLTNFTRYYRKVAQKYYESAISGQKYDGEEVDERIDQGEYQDEAAEGEVSSEREARPYSDFYRPKIIAKARLYPSTTSVKERERRAIAAPSRSLHSTNVNTKRSHPELKRPFKSKEAQEYYQTAIEQCMKIKYKLDKYYQQVNYAIQPPKAKSQLKRELENVASFKKMELEKLKRKDEVEHKVVPELTKIERIKTTKDTNQFKQAKFKITYPTHTVKYKLGTYKLQHKIKKKIVSDHQLKTLVKKPIEEPLISQKIKHQQVSEDEIAKLQKMRYKMHQKKLPYIAQYLQQCGEEEKHCEEMRQRMKQNQTKIQLHPTVRQANASAKMAFKTTYNTLLKKSGLLYKGPKESDNTNVRRDGDGSKQFEPKSPLSAPVTSTWSYPKINKSEEPNNELKVMEHPLGGTKPVKIEPTPKHPKRILTEKSELFDIDTMCLKSNSASTTNNVTTNYGDYVVETEERVRNFVETHKTPAKPLSEHKIKMEVKESKVEVKEEPKGASKIDTITEYLRKLKELRDQTAVDRLRLKKFIEHKKIDLVQKAEGKKIQNVMGRLEKEVEKTPLDFEIQKDLKAIPKIESEVPVKDETQFMTEKQGLATARVPETIVEVTGPKTKQYPISDKLEPDRLTGLHSHKNEKAVNEKIMRRLRPYEDKERSRSAVNLIKEKNLIRRIPSLKNARSESLPKRSRSRSPKNVKVAEKTVKEPEKPSLSVEEGTKHQQKKQDNPLSMIMGQYMVQSKEAMSMAELKRINRRRRRSRELKLKEDAKKQEKKLEEEGKRAVMEGIQRKHKFRLDNMLDATNAPSKDNKANRYRLEGIYTPQGIEKTEVLKEVSKGKAENVTDNLLAKDVNKVSNENVKKVESVVSKEKETLDKSTNNTHVKTSSPNRYLLTEQQKISEEKEHRKIDTNRFKDDREIREFNDVSQVTTTQNVKNQFSSENLGKLSEVIKEQKPEKRLNSYALEKVADMKKSFEEKKGNLMKFVGIAIKQKKDSAAAEKSEDEKTKQKENNMLQRSSEKLGENVNAKNEQSPQDLRNIENEVLAEERPLKDPKKSENIKRQRSLESLVKNALQQTEKQTVKEETKKSSGKTSKEKEPPAKLTTNEKEKENPATYFKPLNTNVAAKEERKPDNSSASEVVQQKKSSPQLTENIKKSMAAALEQKIPQVLKEAAKAIKELRQKQHNEVRDAIDISKVLEEKPKRVADAQKSIEPKPDEKVKPNSLTAKPKQDQLTKQAQVEEKAADTISISQQTKKKKSREKWPGGFKSFKQKIEDSKTASTKEPQQSEVVKSVETEKSIKEQLYKTQMENLRKLKVAGTKIVELVEQMEDLKFQVQDNIEKSASPENRPTIRKEKPEPNREKQKKEQPKTKPDIVLPSKGQNEPKMQHNTNENNCLETLKRDIIEEINKELRNNTLQNKELVSLDKVRKCKSLADLAGEQKAKILKEIEVSWNEENSKTKKNCNLCSKSETLLNPIEEINEQRIADNISDGIEQSIKIPLLIIKLKYPPLSMKPNENQSDMLNLNNLQVSENIDDELKTHPSVPPPSSEAITCLRVDIEDLPSTPEQLVNVAIKDKKLMPKESSHVVQVEKHDPIPVNLYFSKMKRGRIENDDLQIEPIAQTNMGFVPKDVLWHTQDDLDICFSKMKRGRIENDPPEMRNIEEIQDSQRSENRMEQLQSISVKVTPSVKEVKKDKQEGEPQKMEPLVKYVSPIVKVTPPVKEVKKNKQEGEPQKMGHLLKDCSPIVKCTSPPKEAKKKNQKTESQKIESLGKEVSPIEKRRKPEKCEKTIDSLKESAPRKNIDKSSNAGKDPVRKIEPKTAAKKSRKEAVEKAAKPKKCKVSIKKKHQSASRIELKKKLSKSLAPKCKGTSYLIGERLTKAKSAPIAGKKHTRKRDNTEDVSDCEILANNGFKTKNNVKKLIKAMKKADEELEEILKSYQVYKKPEETATEKNISKVQDQEQMRLNRERTQVLVKKPKTGEKIYKNSMDSKTYVVKNLKEVKKDPKISAGASLKTSNLQAQTNVNLLIKRKTVVNKKSKSELSEKMLNNRHHRYLLTPKKHHKYLLSPDQKITEENRRETKTTLDKTKTKKISTALEDVPPLKTHEKVTSMEMKDAAKKSATVDQVPPTSTPELIVVAKENLTEKPVESIKLSNVLDSTMGKKISLMNKDKLSSEIQSHLKGIGHSNNVCNNQTDSEDASKDVEKNGPPQNEGNGGKSDEVSDTKLLIRLFSREESGNKIIAASSKEDEGQVKTEDPKQKEEKDVDVPGKRTSNLSVDASDEFQVSIPRDTTVPHETPTLNIMRMMRFNRPHRGRNMLTLYQIKEEDEEEELKVLDTPQFASHSTAIFEEDPILPQLTGMIVLSENDKGDKGKKSGPKKTKKKARFTFSRSSFIEMYKKPFKKPPSKDKNTVKMIFVNDEAIKCISGETLSPVDSKSKKVKPSSKPQRHPPRTNDRFVPKPIAKTFNRKNEAQHNPFQMKQKNKRKMKSLDFKNTPGTNLLSERGAEEEDTSDVDPLDKIHKDEILKITKNIRKNISRTKHMLEKQLEILRAVKVPERSRMPVEDMVKLEKTSEIRYGKNQKILALLDRRLTQEVGKMLVQDKSLSSLQKDAAFEELTKIPLQQVDETKIGTQKQDGTLEEIEEKDKTDITERDKNTAKAKTSLFKESKDKLYKFRNNYLGNAYKRVKHILSMVKEENRILKRKNMLEGKAKMDKEEQDAEKKSNEMKFIYSHPLERNILKNIEQTEKTDEMGKDIELENANAKDSQLAEEKPQLEGKNLDSKKLEMESKATTINDIGQICEDLEKLEESNWKNVKPVKHKLEPSRKSERQIGPEVKKQKIENETNAINDIEKDIKIPHKYQLESITTSEKRYTEIEIKKREIENDIPPIKEIDNIDKVLKALDGLKENLQAHKYKLQTIMKSESKTVLEVRKQKIENGTKTINEIGDRDKDQQTIYGPNENLKTSITGSENPIKLETKTQIIEKEIKTIDNIGDIEEDLKIVDASNDNLKNPKYKSEPITRAETQPESGIKKEKIENVPKTNTIDMEKNLKTDASKENLKTNILKLESIKTSESRTESEIKTQKKEDETKTINNVGDVKKDLKTPDVLNENLQIQKYKSAPVTKPETEAESEIKKHKTNENNTVDDSGDIKKDLKTAKRPNEELNSLTKPERQIQFEVETEFNKFYKKEVNQSGDDRKLIETISNIIAKGKTRGDGMNKEDEKKNTKDDKDKKLANIRSSTENIKQNVAEQKMVFKKLEDNEKTEPPQETIQKVLKLDKTFKEILPFPKKDQTIQPSQNNQVTKNQRFGTPQNYAQLISSKSQSCLDRKTPKENHFKSQSKPCLSDFYSPSKNNISSKENFDYTYTIRRLRQRLMNNNIETVQKNKDKSATILQEETKIKEQIQHLQELQESKNKNSQMICKLNAHGKRTNTFKQTQKETSINCKSVSIYDEKQTQTERPGTNKYAYLDPKASLEQLKDKMYMEAKMHKIFEYYLTHRKYFKNKYSKNPMQELKQDLEMSLKETKDNQSLFTTTQNNRSNLHLTPSVSLQKNPPENTQTPKKLPPNETTKNDTICAIKLQENIEDNTKENQNEKTSQTTDNHAGNEQIQDQVASKVEIKALVPVNPSASQTIATPQKQLTKLLNNEFKNENKGPLKAKIEEILSKQCKEDDKICKFNKNLMKHIKQRSSQTLPQEVQKQGIIPLTKTLLDPRVLDVYDMRRTLYKYLAMELRKPYHERSTKFSLLDKYNKCKPPTRCTDKEERFINVQANEERPKELLKGPYYIEKSPPNRYQNEKTEEPSNPVPRSCDKLCLPLKNISQVALKTPIEEETTLNKAQSEKIQVAPKIEETILDKYKGLKITQINIKRRGRSEENFLPMIFGLNKQDAKNLEARNTYEEAKKQIVEFRYELLRKLHKEFHDICQKDVNKNVGRFEKVSKFYKSVTEKMKKESSDDIAVVPNAKSMEELLGPCPKPSFENVSRYYKSILKKDNKVTGKEDDKKDIKATGEDGLNRTKNLIQKLSEETTELDTSRNDLKGADVVLTKSSKKEDDKGNDPTNSGN